MSAVLFKHRVMQHSGKHAHVRFMLLFSSYSWLQIENKPEKLSMFHTSSVILMHIHRLSINKIPVGCIGLFFCYLLPLYREMFWFYNHTVPYFLLLHCLPFSFVSGLFVFCTDWLQIYTNWVQMLFLLCECCKVKLEHIWKLEWKITVAPFYTLFVGPTCQGFPQTSVS